jgi:hypothetical protein
VPFGTPPGAAARADALDRLIAGTEDTLELSDRPRELADSPRRSFDEVLSVVASSLGDERHDALPGAATEGRAETTAEAGRGRTFFDGPSVLEGTPLLIAKAPPPPPPEPPLPHGSGDDETPGAEAPADAPTSSGPIVEVQPVTRPPAASPDASSDPAPAGPTPPGAVPAVFSPLRQLGFPDALLEKLPPPEDGANELLEAFAHVPTPRPVARVAGALVCVVGEIGEALATAGDLADELGLDDADICVASPGELGFALDRHLVVADTKRATALAPGWRRDGVAIVAVDATHPAATSAWLRSMLRALRPTTTWALVSATAKAEDIAHFARSIGGVDALVVADLDKTVTPAAVLATAIPVARVGGEPATPEAWLDALGARLDLVDAHRER